MIKQRADVAAAELKYLVHSGQLLSLELLLLIQAAFVDIIKRHVTDESALAAISAEMSKVTDGRAP